MTDFAAPTEIPRDRWQRPLVIPPGGGTPTAYTRCTTYVDCLDDKYNLQKWQQRMVAVGIARRPDLHLAASASAADPDSNKRQLDRICDDAREAAGASSKATIGTALHELTERIDRGLDVGAVPDMYKPHLKAYEEATGALTAVHIEEFMVCDELKIGGTADRIVRVKGLDGCFIADVKTGPSTLKYGAGKVAMQLAVYAHSKLYRPTDGARGNIPGLNIDRGIVIALNSETGTCTLHWIDLTQGWEAVTLASQVREWRTKRTDHFVTRFDITGRDTVVAPAIENAILAASSVEELLNVWMAADTKGMWTPAHTDLAATRKAELTQPPVQASA